MMEVVICGAVTTCWSGRVLSYIVSLPSFIDSGLTKYTFMKVDFTAECWSTLH